MNKRWLEKLSKVNQIMSKIDKGPIIGLLKFRDKQRGLLLLRVGRNWANRSDLLVPIHLAHASLAWDKVYMGKYKKYQDLTPLSAANHLISLVHSSYVPGFWIQRLAEQIEASKTSQIIFRELQIKNHIEICEAEEVVNA